VAVGIRACNRCSRELATGAWARLHDHRLTPGLLQMFPDDASKYIGTGTDDDLDRPVGKALCPRRRR
jgi:hypothetical protein